MKERLDRLEERIRRAAERAGRRRDEIRVVWVTKQVSAERVEEAYALGLRDFGENRVQEWVKKAPLLPSDIHWHLVGPLQTNKVKFLDSRVAWVHAVDRVECARALARSSEARRRPLAVLLEVNTSGEPAKFGVRTEEAPRLAEEALSLPGLEVRGLMTMAPFTQEEAPVRNAFRRLADLRKQLARQFGRETFSELSMGMSGDFEIAVEEGATWLRIGTALFGPREESP